MGCSDNWNYDIGLALDVKVYVRDSLKVEAERIESEALTFEDRARIEIFCKSNTKRRFRTAFEVTATTMAAWPLINNLKANFCQ